MHIYNARELDVMNNAGFFGGDGLSVHCTKSDDRDVRIMKDLDIKISHNPWANMYLGEGVAPTPNVLTEGVTFSLGTDESATNFYIGPITQKKAIFLSDFDCYTMRRFSLNSSILL